ncbi:long-chain-fatty-acid--CoA ligase 6-like isoform X2 [Montipora capricornis]|uniref:long-chain-fatty-acid--CoA ligase 6-like isoform X2 n=1 Tax=Montipora foliosa TaxID=591990 RepID=UPI0035F1A476
MFHGNRLATRRTGRVSSTNSQMAQQSVQLEGASDGARRCASRKELISFFNNEIKTPYEGFLHTLRTSGKAPCLGARGGPENKYQWLTFDEVHERASNLGSGLVNIGCEPSQNTFVGIYGPNCIEWDLADLACQMFSMVSVPIYDTHGAEGCLHIIIHADITTIICNGSKLRFLFDNAKECKKVKRIIKMDCEAQPDEKREAESLGIKLLDIVEVEQIGSNSPQEKKPGKPEDLFTISYTSGTTGIPKGAMITNANMTAGVSGVLWHYEQAGVKTRENDCLISYLPLAHSYERLVHQFCFATACRIGFFRGDIKLLVEDIQELKPTMFPSVPRLLTRIYDKVLAQVSQSKVKKWLFQKAMASKQADLKRGIVKGDTIWDKLVFKKVRMLLGGNVRLISSGAAPLSSNVMTFLRCVLGECYVIEGYGQTETVATGTITMISDLTAGHVGPPLACNLIKLADVPQKECYAKNGRGEICFKGPNVFKGYLKAPEITAETIDKDGWLHTGDIGEWLPNGALKIVDRVKHIFKLSQGEYVAPEKIENVYLRSPLVAQAFVHGDSFRSYVVGIIVPDQEVLESWARAKKISGDFGQLCENPVVKKEILDDIIQKGKEAELNSFEQVKAISLHKDLFSVENGFLTPTFKTKRPFVQKFFEKKFQELYKEVDKRA